MLIWSSLSLIVSDEDNQLSFLALKSCKRIRMFAAFGKGGKRVLPFQQMSKLKLLGGKPCREIKTKAWLILVSASWAKRPTKKCISMELSALISRQQARKSWWFYLRKRAYLRGQGWVIRDRSLKALVRTSADQFSGEIKLQEVKEAAAAARELRTTSVWTNLTGLAADQSGSPNCMGN